MSSINHVVNKVKTLTWKDCTVGSRLVYNWMTGSSTCVTDSKDHCEFFLASLGACYSCDIGYKWTRSVSGAASCVLKPVVQPTPTSIDVNSNGDTQVKTDGTDVNVHPEENFLELSTNPEIAEQAQAQNIFNNIKTVAKKVCAFGSRSTFNWLTKVTSCVTDSLDHCNLYMFSRGACFACETGYKITRIASGANSCTLKPVTPVTPAPAVPVNTEVEDLEKYF